MARFALKISGIVQGVGFRPFMYRIALANSLSGFVRNTSYGVYAEIEGEDAACARFLSALENEPPPLSRITLVEKQPMPEQGGGDFRIVSSIPGTRLALISPDIAICDACRAEIFDPADRRYHYPFTNCTDCGPRFTIIKDIPYDRRNTTMARFIQCPKCQAEYDDPANRRFHAQPNACPVCGPSLAFVRNGERQEGDALALFKEAMAHGETVAVKGIGGYNLACDASNEAAVSRLRRNKLRYDKPFAVMMRDTAAVRGVCELSNDEETLLTSRRAPIVLLNKLPGRDLAPSVAPGNARLGVMLPYTPLHCLIMEEQNALVMTSANISERPMVFRDEDALGADLERLADAVLTHDRAIWRRMDDSVCAVYGGSTHIIRRARGYVPEPVTLPGGTRNVLALGAQQKNTFCLAKGADAFVSGHIGDLDDPDTEKSFVSEIDSFIRIFDAEPSLIACDMHPDYISTRCGEALSAQRKLPLVKVQHHRAHFASVLAEHAVSGPAVGLIFDGTGYGDDGTVWGGEALAGTMTDSRRAGHLLPFRLLGGEAAVREPWRTALSAAGIALGADAALTLFPEREKDAELLFRAERAGLNAPVTTSMGRLFDAVAAIAGLRQTTTYEGQAAVELEQAADMTGRGAYAFEILKDAGVLVFDWRGVIADAVRDRRRGVPPGVISARFHRACVDLAAEAASRLCAAAENGGTDTVALSGGCFQNALLLTGCMKAISARGLKPLTNEKLPVNDAGISFGQAAAVRGRED